jgi:uncharacterized protein
MKKLLILLFCVIQISLSAQTNAASNILFENAVGYLRGITRTYNPQLGKKLLDSAIALGNAKAMNAMGNVCAQGTVVNKNIDSALYWYKRSLNRGYEGACINLGNLYRFGKEVPQNFKEATKYYIKGVAQNDNECKTLLAYMYYKGLGIQQDYEKSFLLYKESAEMGNESSMYFLGICYKNGYGTAANKVLANEWLQKAASKNNRLAAAELKEEVPENISAINPYLQNQLLQLKNSKEKFIAANENNYEGLYVGYAVYYDWSGKFVSEIQPLALKLSKAKGTYNGKWKEGIYEEVDITLTNKGNEFEFSENSAYKRNNHYSARSPETWNFNKANISLSFKNDSIMLSGFVQFYSKERREPGKPLQIILKKGMGDIDTEKEKVNFVIFPNPSLSFTTIEFNLLKTAKVSFKIFAENGVLVYADTEKLLPQGVYKYNLPAANLIAGTYNIQLMVNGKKSTTNILVKQ